MITAQVGAVQPPQCFLGPPSGKGRPALCMHCGASLYRHTYTCTLPKYQQAEGGHCSQTGLFGKEDVLGRQGADWWPSWELPPPISASHIAERMKEHVAASNLAGPHAFSWVLAPVRPRCSLPASPGTGKVCGVESSACEEGLELLRALRCSRPTEAVKKGDKGDKCTV